MRDTSLETMPQWMHDLPRLIDDKDWGRIQLRIELEHLIRRPMTGALVFNIRSYMAPLAEFATIPEWAGQLADIVEELPGPTPPHTKASTAPGCRRWRGCGPTPGLMHSRGRHLVEGGPSRPRKT